MTRQRVAKHIPAEANVRNNRASIASQRRDKHALWTIHAVFSVGFVNSGYKGVEFWSWQLFQLSVQLWSVNQRTTEAEESRPLRFVMRKRLVKTGRGIAIVESCYQVKTSENRLRRLSVEWLIVGKSAIEV
jgi:hypothetical protein